MSRHNKVNPDHYKQAGRLSQDDAARERAQQRAVPSRHEPGASDRSNRFSDRSSQRAGVMDREAPIEVDEVKRRLARGERVVFVDARNPQAWSEATTKLPGAIRLTPDEAEQHLPPELRNRTVVTYCT